jgi:integrase
MPFFGATRIDAINAFQIERYKRDRLTAGAAKATVNRELSTLRHVLGMAVEWGWIDRLPAKPARFTEDNQRIITLSDAEIERLLQAAIADSDPGLWLFIEIARATGRRHSEILRIQWKDCDLASRRIFLPQAKAGSRAQPITEGLAAILKRERAQRTDQEGGVFPARYPTVNQKPHFYSFGPAFRRAVLAAGLDPRSSRRMCSGTPRSRGWSKLGWI